MTPQIFTKQTAPIIGREAEMGMNKSGGYCFTVDAWTQFERFMILGTVAPRYAVGAEKKFTKDDATIIRDLLKVNPARVIDMVVQISDSGRAPNNDSALFALAVASSSDNVDVRRLAFEALPKVARIGTHLFHYINYVEMFRGWGRALKRTVASWYTSVPVDKMVYQVIKYQQRDGWSNRDVLRLAHPKTTDQVRNSVFQWITKPGTVNEFTPGQIQAFERAKSATSAQDVVDLIVNWDLPREAIPTQFLNEVAVWEALLEKMPLNALVRNLGKMTEVGLLTSSSAATKTVVDRLGNESYIKKSRQHPLGILTALKTYTSGGGFRGKLSWKPVQNITDGLDGAFYMAFQNVTPTNKRYLIGVDCSGSMSSAFSQNSNLSSRDVAAALALVTANVEPYCDIVGFTSGSGSWSRSNTGLTHLGIKPAMRMDTVLDKVNRTDWGSTDCSLPFLYASKTKTSYDGFLVITDNETYAGSVQPAEALRKYRQDSGIAAKSVVVATSPSAFSIADPKDGGMLDVSGMDTSVPAVINDFMKD